MFIIFFFCSISMSHFTRFAKRFGISQERIRINSQLRTPSCLNCLIVIVKSSSPRERKEISISMIIFISMWMGIEKNLEGRGMRWTSWLCIVLEYKPLSSIPDLFWFMGYHSVWFRSKLNNLHIFDKAMEPICYMLPFLLLNVGFSPLKYKDLANMSPFFCKRLLPAQVP